MSYWFPGNPAGVSIYGLAGIDGFDGIGGIGGNGDPSFGGFGLYWAVPPLIVVDGVGVNEGEHWA